MLNFIAWVLNKIARHNNKRGFQPIGRCDSFFVQGCLRESSIAGTRATSFEKPELRVA